MSPLDECREIRVRVGDNVSVEGYVKDIEEHPIELEPKDDPLRRETIEILVNMLREDRLSREREVRLLGGKLYSVLFDNEIGAEIHRLLREQEFEVVRVVLKFEASQQSLASWPWEYLYCPPQFGHGGTGYFLSAMTRLVLIRHLPSREEARHLSVEATKVKVLFVASSPTNCEGEVEYQPLLESLEALKNVKVHKLLPERPDPEKPPGATYENFQAMLGSCEPHIIHLLAHGRRRGEHGEIAFMDDDEKALWISDEVLANQLWQAPRNLRFVFLQACESALAGSDIRDRYHAISGVAMHLAQKEIPAVVGMQYEIHQGAANLFAQTFYEHLSHSLPLDIAVQRGRDKVHTKEVLAAAREPNGKSRLSFGLPVLYVREPDVPLFPPQEPSVRESTAVGVGHDARPVREVVRPSSTERPQVDAPKSCPWCGEPCQEWENYCGNEKCRRLLKCQAILADGRKCGTPVTKQRATCGFCGTSLDSGRGEFGGTAHG